MTGNKQLQYSVKNATSLGKRAPETDMGGLLEEILLTMKLGR